jgi:hypothetical protein
VTDNTRSTPSRVWAVIWNFQWSISVAGATISVADDGCKVDWCEARERRRRGVTRLQTRPDVRLSVAAAALTLAADILAYGEPAGVDPAPAAAATCSLCDFQVKLCSGVLEQSGEACFRKKRNVLPA